jgi:hypothetical protein
LKAIRIHEVPKSRDPEIPRGPNSRRSQLDQTVRALCPQCHQPAIIGEVTGIDFEDHCQRCNIPIFGQIFPMVERYKNFVIEIVSVNGNTINVHLHKVGGGKDRTLEIPSGRLDEAIQKAREFIDRTSTP